MAELLAGQGVSRTIRNLRIAGLVLAGVAVLALMVLGVTVAAVVPVWYVLMLLWRRYPAPEADPTAAVTELDQLEFHAIEHVVASS